MLERRAGKGAGRLRPIYVSGSATPRLLDHTNILPHWYSNSKASKLLKFRDRLASKTPGIDDSNMLTGIELAGIILGALPLAISLAEHYEGTYDILLDWKLFRGEYCRFMNKLRRQKINFRQFIEPVLWSITSSEKTFHDMLYDPTHSEWKSPKLAERLQMELSLPGEFEVFCSCMITINEELGKLTKALDAFQVVCLISQCATE
jgi:hypothetical protein